MTAASKQVKSGKFPTNHYAKISGQNFEDLGESIDVAVLAWRSKAIRIDADVITTCYNQEDEVFKKIKADSSLSDSGCMYGPEFLLMLEDGSFVVFLMGTSSSRREAAQLHEKIKGMATLSSQFIETKKYSWQAPLIKPCSTPFGEESFDVEALKNALEQFKNPPKSEVEEIKEAEETTRER